MQRYFIQPASFSADHVTITGDDAHHLIRVMRAKAGDRVIVSDGCGREAVAVLRSLEAGEVTAAVEQWLPPDKEPRVDVWIAQSLPKGDKMELVIQKGTEIGAARFIPFSSERTVVQWDAKKEGKRLERWQKIAKEAAEQAHRSCIPAVESVQSWKGLLKLAAEADAAWFCYEKQDAQELRSLIKSALRKTQVSAAETGEGVQAPKPHGTQEESRPKLLVIVGPEGGFSEREAAEAEQAGCRPVSLGKRILRTETAAMVGLTCILYEAGEMGGDE
ncbi:MULTISPECIES: 16S rRNA (uracil(1498)-N(3))-methyltransferase [unclassified Paenibacillus]|uniref:RsmE family RNA methyltransferase n=1 Tax=unclassified Paenibacillus TaxID=185978 RepID=UPI00093072EA|nr:MULTISPECIES: RsmE family RNA methyltransferase [unclassified Paenibacillus]